MSALPTPDYLRLLQNNNEQPQNAPQGLETQPASGTVPPPSPLLWATTAAPPPPPPPSDISNTATAQQQQIYFTPMANGQWPAGLPLPLPFPAGAAAMMAPVPNTTTTSPVDTITDSRKEASAAFRAKRKAKRIEREVAGQDVVSVHQKQKQTLTNSAVVVPVPVPVTSSAVPAHPPLPPPLQQAVGNKRELRAIKNRESAARSRAKRDNNESAIRTEVEQLQARNKVLRENIKAKAAAARRGGEQWPDVTD